MIFRRYICDFCSYTFEIKQPMLEPLKKKCPQCGKKKLYQDLTEGQLPLIITPRTIGSFADKNSKTMKEKVGNKSWYNTSGQNLTRDLKDVISDKNKTTKYIMEGK